MSTNEILTEVRQFDGVLELAPEPDSEFPPISWGDHFFYWSPDGTVPDNRQPYATIITKDYPDDTTSRLDGPDRWRLNIHVGAVRFTELIGESPRAFVPRDFAEADVVLPHPLYGALGWISIVMPGDRTKRRALDLLREAHAEDRRRVERRSRSRS